MTIDIDKLKTPVCCTGEPHTCDQEATAAAEGRADRLIIERDQLRAEVIATRQDWRNACADRDLLGKRVAELQAEVERLRAVYEAACALRDVTLRAERAMTPADCNRQIVDNANAFRVLFETIDTARGGVK